MLAETENRNRALMGQQGEAAQWKALSDEDFVESAWSEFERGEDWVTLKKALSFGSPDQDMWGTRALALERAWLRANLESALRGLPSSASGNITWRAIRDTLRALGGGAAFRELEGFACSIPGVRKDRGNGDRIQAMSDAIADDQVGYVAMMSKTWRESRLPEQKLLAIAQRKMLEKKKIEKERPDGAGEARRGL